MKILFMGTPDFAVGIAEAIYESSHEIVAVVTQPDRPKGRSGASVASPVKEFALSHDIPVLQPSAVKKPEEVEKLKNIDADICVVAAFGQILSKEILDIWPNGCINVHASLLPEYRGAAPIQWAIADGRQTTGVTVQQMNEGVDTGDIISSVAVNIDSNETGGSLFDKLAKAGAGLIVETLDLIAQGRAIRTPQDESAATYAKMLKKEMGCIDFTQSAQRNERLVRAFSPWPGSYTYLDGRLLKIKKCTAVPEGGHAEPGTITKVTKDELFIECGKGTLIVTAVQPEGKREMPVHDLLLGRKIEEGTVLGRH